MDGSVVFATLCQCAFPLGHVGATWQIRLNFCFLWPTWVHNPNDKWIGSAGFAQLTAESPNTLQRAPLSPKIAPSHGGGSGPHLTCDPWAHLSPQSKRRLYQFSRFCTDDRRVSLYFTMGWPFPSKIAPLMGHLDSHPIHGSLSPPESSTKWHLDLFSHFCKAH